jgi:glutathione synthase/RimK-type ligase-like ATP-grasp enzyme
MNILVIAEKKAVAKPIVDAIKEKGVNAEYLRISKIALVSKKNETLIKSLGKELAWSDGVFIQVRASLAPFVEPLLEELHNTGSYTNAKKGSYYIAMNEPYQFVTLALAGTPTPRTLTSGSAKNIEKVSNKISYPLLAKYYIGKTAQQAIEVQNASELNLFIKSIRTETDGFMLREYISGDAVSCAVIGRKVFAVKRKNRNGVIAELAQGETYKLNEEEHKTVIDATNASGLDIARVDIAKGRVVKVDTLINWSEFNKICSENLEEQAATFMIEKTHVHEGKRKDKSDLVSLIKKFSRTLLGGFFK